MANNITAWFPNNTCLRCGNQQEEGAEVYVIGYFPLTNHPDNSFNPFGAESKDVTMFCAKCWLLTGLQAAFDNAQCKYNNRK